MPVKDQHVVSRLVLRRWADEKGLLVSHRIDNGYRRERGPKGLGRIDDFVQAELSVTIEARWAEIENRAGSAIREACAARQPVTDEHAATLTELLALHLIRSHDSRERWATTMRASSRLAQLLAWIDEPGILEGLFRDRTGLYPAGSAAIAEERRIQLAKLETNLGLGGYGFAESTLGTLDETIRRLSKWHVQIGRTAADAPLLIGDTPVVPFDKDTDRTGLRSGLRLGSFSQIVMPIDPHHVLSLGPEPLLVEMPSEVASQLNHLQLMNGREVVMYGTRSGLGGWVDAWRETHVQPEYRQRFQRESPD